ncbi:hypothetical protein J3456_11570 [Sulfitobacter sp. NFXS29]
MSDKPSDGGGPKKPAQAIAIPRQKPLTRSAHLTYTQKPSKKPPKKK